MKNFNRLPIYSWQYDLPIGNDHLLSEFVESRQAVDNLIHEQFLYKQYVLDNIRYVVDKLLTPLESCYGHKLKIMRGYMCRRLTYINSEHDIESHANGFAIDIFNPDNIQVLKAFCKYATFDKICIYRNYTHLSLKTSMNRYSLIDYR